MLCRLLVFVVCDSVITLSEIAYNVNIILGEVLLAIASTVYNGNIFIRSLFFLKVVVSESESTFVSWKDKLNRILKVILVSYFRISCRKLFSL